jgi:acyl-CoA reductase-like NAD-dependent aldehyde dehydrogenase
VIDGDLSVTSESGKIINPATLENNPEVPFSTRDDVNRAVEAAQRTTESWAEVSWDERADAMRRFAHAFEAQAEPFAKILSMETGKPVSITSVQHHSSRDHDGPFSRS